MCAIPGLIERAFLAHRIAIVTAALFGAAGAWAADVDPPGPPPDDRTSIVWLEVLDPIATEQSPDIDALPDVGRIALRRAGDLTSPLTVWFQLSGSAEAGVDYELIAGGLLTSEVQFAAGESTVVIDVLPIDDLLPERAESVILSLIIPPGLAGVPPPYWLGHPQNAMVSIHDNDQPDNHPPSVVVTSPPDGVIFGAPAELLLVAAAVDVDGTVVHVEFFDGEESLGVVTPDLTLDPALLDHSRPDWGPVAPFPLLWKNPGTGVHELTAVATDDDEAATRSLPVQITILDIAPVPVVTVEATDGEAAETSPDATGDVSVNPALFTLHRTGLTDSELEVTFRLRGTAENGIDYDSVPLCTTFPAGESTTSVEIRPIDDGLPEGTESVVLALEARPSIDIFPPPAGVYWVGRPAQARAWILDNEQPANLPPIVQLLQPHDGEVFLTATSLELIALAADRDGTIASVEFFVGDRSLGFGEVDSERPSLYRLVWAEVPAGDFVITAVATDDAGTAQTSRASRIKVVELHSPPVITIETIDATAAEVPTDSTLPPDPARMRVHRSGPTDEELVVPIQLTGSAENGVDYGLLMQRIEFAIGEASVDLDILPLPDELQEGPETVIATLMAVRCRDSADEPGPDERCLGVYEIGRPGVARAVILDDDAPENLPPRVSIVRPANGQIFTGPIDIEVAVVARDPDGWVGVMALYSGDELIEEQVINFLREPDPGEDQVFDFQWRDVQPGAYSIRAKATDDQGAQSWSAPVKILVTPLSDRTVVSVIAVDPLAIEPTPDSEGDPGAFGIYRRGDLSIPLTVYYTVRGSAENGVDYMALEGEVTLPVGQDVTRIPVNPIADLLEENPEYVVLELREPACIAIEPPPPECYRVGQLRTAVVKILDRNEGFNRPPRIELVQPHPGEVFQYPAEIVLVAAAADPDGRVVKVEFLANGQLIHEQVADRTATVSAHSELGAYRFAWNDASAGEHVLVAVATDDDGASSRSKELVILVIDDSGPPLVRVRALDPHGTERPEGVPPDTATFRVRRTGSTEADLVVFYAVGGTATPGEDYSELAGQVLIPAGKHSARVTVDPIIDNEVEGAETVVLELVPSPTAGPIDLYRIGEPAKACVVVVDTDQDSSFVDTLARRLADDGFQICLPAERGMPYRIEASDDMAHWTPLGDTLADEYGRVRFAEPELRRHQHRFYRVRPTIMEAMPLDD